MTTIYKAELILNELLDLIHNMFNIDGFYYKVLPNGFIEYTFPNINITNIDVSVHNMIQNKFIFPNSVYVCTTPSNTLIILIDGTVY